MKKKIFNLILPIVTLILEILPYGAVCVFAPSPTERSRETFSYFDLTPFGYANFTPFITAVLTCGIIIIIVLYCVTGKEGLSILARNTLFITSIISLGPLLFGISFFSVVGALITIFLICELILLHFHIKKQSRMINFSSLN